MSRRSPQKRLRSGSSDRSTEGESRRERYDRPTEERSSEGSNRRKQDHRSERHERDRDNEGDGRSARSRSVERRENGSGRSMEGRHRNSESRLRNGSTWESRRDRHKGLKTDEHRTHRNANRRSFPNEYRGHRQKRDEFGRQRRYASYEDSDLLRERLLESFLTNSELKVFEEEGIIKGSLIEKEFLFPGDKCTLPDASGMFSTRRYAVEDLIKEKDTLNGVKGQLDHKDLELWGKHTSRTNVMGATIFRVREIVKNAEMVTIAWAKLYEILFAYDLLRPTAFESEQSIAAQNGPSTSNIVNGNWIQLATAGESSQCESVLKQMGEAASIRTLHICEAPGGFVCATNHYIKSHLKEFADRWSWIGYTMNPYFEGNNLNEMIDDDRFICDTLSRWYFGEDNTGDIRPAENIQSLWKFYRRRHGGRGAHLVTADGSISCIDSPGEQEAMTAHLHYCELIAAIGILEKGGNAVLKMFTYFEHKSISILYIASACFKKVRVCKPATSKAGNSETYLVCKGFLGISEEHLSALLCSCRVTEDVEHTPIPLSTIEQTEGFLENVKRCARLFSRLQQSIINRNLRLFEIRDREFWQGVNLHKTMASDLFLKRFQIKDIDISDRIIRGYHVTGSFQVKGRAQQAKRGDGFKGGSWAEIKKRKQMEQDEGKVTEEKVVSAAKRMKYDHCVEQSSGVDCPQMTSTTEGTNGDSVDDNLADSLSVAEKIMRKMGYTSGSRLGVTFQGIASPLDLQHNEAGAGIGYLSEDIERVVLGEEELQAPYVSAPADTAAEDGYMQVIAMVDGTDEKVSLTKILELSMAFEPVYGKKVCAPSMSKFFEQTMLEKLTVQRKRVQLLWKAVGEQREVLEQRRKQAFPSLLLGYSEDVAAWASLLSKHGFLEEKLFDRKREGELLTVASLTRERSAFLALTSSSLLSVHLPAIKLVVIEENLLDPEKELGFFGVVEGRKQNKQLYDVVLLDCRAELRDNLWSCEMQDKLLLLKDLLVTIPKVNEGGDLVCFMRDAVTRVSVGVLFLCFLLFDTVNLVRPPLLCQDRPERFLVAKGFRRSLWATVGWDAYKDRILSSLEEAPANLDLLEIVPIAFLNEKRFWQLIAKRNERFSLVETSAIDRLLKAVEDESSVDSEEVARLVTKLKEEFGL